MEGDHVQRQVADVSEAMQTHAPDTSCAETKRCEGPVGLDDDPEQNDVMEMRIPLHAWI